MNEILQLLRPLSPIGVHDDNSLSVAFRYPERLRKAEQWLQSYPDLIVEPLRKSPDLGAVQAEARQNKWTDRELKNLIGLYIYRPVKPQRKWAVTVYNRCEETDDEWTFTLNDNPRIAYSAHLFSVDDEMGGQSNDRRGFITVWEDIFRRMGSCWDTSGLAKKLADEMERG